MNMQFTFCLIAKFWIFFLSTPLWLSLPYILCIPYIQHRSCYLGLTTWVLLLPVGKSQLLVGAPGKDGPWPRRIWPLTCFVLCPPPGLLVMSPTNSPECTYMPSVQSQESVQEPQKAKTEAGWMKRGRTLRALLLITSPLGQSDWCLHVKQPFPTSTKSPI